MAIQTFLGVLFCESNLGEELTVPLQKLNINPKALTIHIYGFSKLAQMGRAVM